MHHHKQTRPRRAYVPPFDPAHPPPRVTRPQLAHLLLVQLGLQVSPRSLESWPLPSRLLNGRATFDTAEAVAYGRKLLDAAPSLRGGRTRKAD